MPILCKSKRAFAAGSTHDLLADREDTTNMPQEQRHKRQYIDASMDPRFFKKDFFPSMVREFDFVRSPFYNLAQIAHIKEGEEAKKAIEELQIKVEMTDITDHILKGPGNYGEELAFPGYADRITKPEVAEKLQWPRREKLNRKGPFTQLFRVSKTEDHWSQVTRSKVFL